MLTLNIIPTKNSSLHGIPGIYVLNHPFYTNTVKIGSSTNIGRRVKDSCYTTMFLEHDVPKLLDYFRVEGYETTEEVTFLERAIHRILNAHRVNPNRELFTNVTPIHVNEIIINYGLTISRDRTPVNQDRTPDKSGEDNVIVLNNNLVPLYHQVPIINSLKDYFASNTRGKLILPCGYGKMYISLFFLRDIIQNGEVIIVLVPSLILSEQFYEVAMAILSNWVVLQYNGNYKNITLSEQEKNLIICTYQSVHELVPMILIEKVSYIIYDEAHRTCVTSKGVNEYSLFRSTIDLYPNANKLFMTATEKIVTCSEKVVVSNKEVQTPESNGKDEEIQTLEPNGKDEDGTEEDTYYSMDNLQIYGDTIYHKSFDQAVEEGTVSDYRLAICAQDDDPLSVIRTGFTELNLCHLLTYSNTCENAQDLYNVIGTCPLLRSLGVEAFYLDGTHKEPDRKEILRKFERSQLGILCSVKVLQEGISLPYVDSVYFVEPRSSEIDIVQMIGRALRLYKDKTLATILLPRTMLKYGQILKTLVMMDSRLKTDFGIKRRLIELSGKVTHGSNEGAPIGSCLNKIKLHLLKRGEGFWEYKLNLCLDWEQLNPEKILPRNIIFKGIDIGNWLKHLRVIYKKQAKGEKYGAPLTITQLNSLNNLYTWRNFVEIIREFGGNKHEMKLNACVQWEMENPDRSITFRAIYKGINIGRWIERQKKLWVKHKNGENGESSPLLERLNILFSWRTWIENTKNEKEDQWTKRYNLCMEWQQEHPNIIIASRDEHKQNKIGRWFYRMKSIWSSQRIDAPINSGLPLSVDQLDKLSKLYSWNIWISGLDSGKRHGDWMGKFQACIESEKNHPNVPIHHAEEFKDIKIGIWMSKLKGIYSKQIMGQKHGKDKNLSQEQLNLLNQLYTWREWIKSKYPQNITIVPSQRLSLSIIKE
ncbi:Helicase [uncultured virus]|nr:Helicase [uncultured virus]